MTTINCNTLNASVAVNTANVHCTNTVSSVNSTLDNITSSGTANLTNVNVSNTFSTVDMNITGNLTIGGAINAADLNLANVTASTKVVTPLLQVDTIAGDTIPSQVIIQSGVELIVNEISAAVDTTFHKTIIMDASAPADIHVPSGSTLFTNTLTPNSGTVITCPNEINTLYLSANNSVVTDLLLSKTGPDLTVNANLLVNNPNILRVDNMTSATGTDITINQVDQLVLDNISATTATNFHKNIVMDGNANADIHVPVGSTLHVDKMDKDFGAFIEVAANLSIDDTFALILNNSIPNQGALSLDTNGRITAIQSVDSNQVQICDWPQGIQFAGNGTQRTLTIQNTYYSIPDSSWTMSGFEFVGATPPNIDSGQGLQMTSLYNKWGSFTMNGQLHPVTSVADAFEMILVKNPTFTGSGQVTAGSALNESFVTMGPLTAGQDYTFSSTWAGAVAPNDIFVPCVKCTSNPGRIVQFNNFALSSFCLPFLS